MNAVRRAYLYLAAAFSLQAATWAVIGLLRALLSAEQTAVPEATAFYISVLVVATPLFLAHWLLAQRDASQHEDDRSAVLRRVYLFGMLALFVIPLLANTFGLLTALFGMALGVPEPVVAPRGYVGPLDIVPANLVAIAVLAVLAVYHARIVVSESTTVPFVGRNGSVRRIFVFGFSALGLALAVVGTIQILRWLMVQLDPLDVLNAGSTFGAAPKAVLAREAARALVGLVVWAVAWSRAQRMYQSGEREEHSSVLRKGYVYAAVFAGVVGTVGALGMLLTGVFRKILGLPVGGDMSGPVPVAIVMAVVWAYHAMAARADDTVADDEPRQAAVRSLYRYLVAGVGLATALLGLAGLVQIVVQIVADGVFSDPLREQLALSAAAVVAGAPVWLWQWSRVQSVAVTPGPTGAGARGSLVRKIYLYFFLFLATIVVLTGAVFIVFRLMAMLLGADATDTEMTIRAAEAAGYCVIGVLVWLYHGRALHADAALGANDQADLLHDTHTLVLGAPGESLGQAVTDAVRRELPGMPVRYVELGNADVGAGSASAVSIDDADVVVGAWRLMASGAVGGTDTDSMVGTIAASGATKVLLPSAEADVAWAGVDRFTEEDLIEQAVHAVRQVAFGQPVAPVRPLGAGAVIGIVVLALVLFVSVVVPIVGFMLQGGIGYLLGG